MTLPRLLQVAAVLHTLVMRVTARREKVSTAPPLVLSTHCCAWFFCLLAALDSILAQEGNLASDLRLLLKIAIVERSQLQSSPREHGRQHQGAAAINVLIVLLGDSNRDLVA